jgi:hypothetical protein
VDTSVLKYYIFRVEVCRVRNLLGFIGGLQGRWSLTSTGGGKDTAQSDLIGTVKWENGPPEYYHHRKEVEL